MGNALRAVHQPALSPREAPGSLHQFDHVDLDPRRDDQRDDSRHRPVGHHGIRERSAHSHSRVHAARHRNQLWRPGRRSKQADGADSAHGGRRRGGAVRVRTGDGLLRERSHGCVHPRRRAGARQRRGRRGPLSEGRQLRRDGQAAHRDDARAGRGEAGTAHGRGDRRRARKAARGHRGQRDHGHTPRRHAVGARHGAAYQALRGRGWPNSTRV
jgi:hypothetical protein